MVIWCRLAPVSQRLGLTVRFYARKTITTTDANMKQVHQQTLRYICPDASVKIDSDITVKVRSADLHMFPNGDAFIAELHGDPVHNCTASMVINISDDERHVEVTLRKLSESTDFHCELAVPVKAALDISTHSAATVKDTYGDELKVRAATGINIQNVRAEKIELLSSKGDIRCQGLLLGKLTTVETQNKGNIILDKLQGDSIKCKSTQGNITTNCSYVESSEFQTRSGNLNLKNVHKKTVVKILEKGDLNMTGVHGNLKVFVNEGSVNLQLSQLQEKNSIEVNKLTSSTINISEEIENSIYVNVSLNGDVNTTAINLDSTLEHLCAALTENKQQFKINSQEQRNTLNVFSKSSLTLGKSSWMDMMRIQMTEKQPNKS